MTASGESPTGTAGPASLFEPVGSEPETWFPTELSRGPWSLDSLHGGPVAALMTRAAQRLESPIPTRLARITVELFAPVPFVALTIETSVIRPGKRVSTVELKLKVADSVEAADSDAGSEGQVLAVARAQRIRIEPVDFPDGASDQVPEFPDSASVITPWPGQPEFTFHANAVEHRFTSGGFDQIGPADDWICLLVPVVPGEEPTGWQRAAATADFTNGLSSLAPFDGKSVFINPDLTIALWREPQGEWLCNQAVTRTSDTGIGLSHAKLWDSSGLYGHGIQTLYLDR